MTFSFQTFIHTQIFNYGFDLISYEIILLILDPGGGFGQDGLHGSAGLVQGLEAAAHQGPHRLVVVHVRRLNHCNLNEKYDLFVCSIEIFFFSKS